MEEEKGALVQSLIDAVNQIASIDDYSCAVKKEYCNLARRLKMLTSMFEEIRESTEQIPEETVKALVSLKEALASAKELLRFGSEGSKIYMVLEREQIMHKFHEVTTLLEQALSRISYENLDILDEVKEQVELVLAQFRRAKGRVDAPDVELYDDLLSLYNKSNDATADPDILRRLAEKLQLVGIAELTQESLALHEMVYMSGGDPGAIFEKMSNLLKKIKDFVQTENPNLDAPAREKNLPPSSGSGQTIADRNHKTPVIPDDFRCPISLELMKDPVIVSTGQTYERSCMEKWLEQGHGTCPKTQQTLSNTSLTPNYALRSLIDQWCEANGIEPPKRPSSSRPSKTKSAFSPAERDTIEILLRKLTSSNPEDQRMAAGEIRLLAKRNADNRVAIAEAGAIPLLVCLLSTPDSRTQEHAVTALLNLSICGVNRGRIVFSGAVPGIVQVLKKGSMEARENAAATLFSLSIVDENKVAIGASGAIPPLVTLLKPGSGMVDEALAILAILASHPEGKSAIGTAKVTHVLVDFIGNGSPRNKENAAAILVHLCAEDQHLAEVEGLGVMGHLVDLAQNGTERGKRKAAQLLQWLSRFVEQQKQAEAEAQQSLSQAQQMVSPSVANAVDS
ncbi:U-box domain-containing protein 13 [Hibiscus syriacus]|uniref:RING-type E3 ubiquitin transferase n=1 Tax=Hibiscus syriacus TaxID=106335 RepID=A0A6A3D302_HIBSY|nr:U-box domain-containing protein 13 [Hibiscus syriacus]